MLDARESAVEDQWKNNVETRFLASRLRRLDRHNWATRSLSCAVHSTRLPLHSGKQGLQRNDGAWQHCRCFASTTLDRPVCSPRISLTSRASTALLGATVARPCPTFIQLTVLFEVPALSNLAFGSAKGAGWCRISATSGHPQCGQHIARMFFHTVALVTRWKSKHEQEHK